jgi:uncharacterized cupin superfamily protein
MSDTNVYSAALAYAESNPDGYRAGRAGVGAAAGGKALAVKLYELPPGQAACPYHYEYEEEWLLVLEGEIVLRTPDGQRTLGRGELVCFAPGAAGAHKTTNAASEPARILMFSSAREPAVAVYPDSDKLGVWPGNDADELMVRRADGAAGYWDGER